MLFNSYEFLFLLLPLTLLGYYVVLPKSWRLYFLTVVSYIFYGWWDYRFCGLMLLTTVINYVSALGVARAVTPLGRRSWLYFCVGSGLAILGFFKYYGLFAHTANGLAGWIAGAPLPILPELQLILPIGISFYTFHSMSYVIDVYRGAVQPTRNFISFACFVSLFTQLVAGPIIRYRDLAAQLMARTHTLQKAALGLAFFTLGMAKKLLLADGVSPVVASCFGVAQPDFITAWTGVLSYTMQIYFDFSGYSDMAVGLGYLFGFEIMQNFHSPYKAVSITDFWRRWHISLSTWLRDYLYIPLGGSRGGTLLTYRNLVLTMLLGGLWHGANWTFVLWGAYHGFILALERMTGCAEASRARGFRRAGTFVLVMVGWVFFRSANLEEAGRLLSGMFGVNGWGNWVDLRDLAGGYLLALLALATVLVFVAPNTWQLKWTWSRGQVAALVVLILACVGAMLVNTSSPFLYFQF